MSLRLATFVAMLLAGLLAGRVLRVPTEAAPESDLPAPEPQTDGRSGAPQTPSARDATDLVECQSLLAAERARCPQEDPSGPAPADVADVYAADRAPGYRDALQDCLGDEASVWLACEDTPCLLAVVGHADLTLDIDGCRHTFPAELPTKPANVRRDGSLAPGLVYWLAPAATVSLWDDQLYATEQDARMLALLDRIRAELGP